MREKLENLNSYAKNDLTDSQINLMILLMLYRSVSVKY